MHKTDGKLMGAAAPIPAAGAGEGGRREAGGPGDGRQQRANSTPTGRWRGQGQTQRQKVMVSQTSQDKNSRVMKLDSAALSQVLTGIHVLEEETKAAPTLIFTNLSGQCKFTERKSRPDCKRPLEVQKTRPL